MFRLLVSFVFAFVSFPALAATDSYRWLHVTIDTPWAIFIFLLPMVLFPVILMAFLYWRYLTKKPNQGKVEDYSDDKLYKENLKD